MAHSGVHLFLTSFNRGRGARPLGPPDLLLYPEPTTHTSIHVFVEHYCQFIKDFAKIDEPLHDYTRGDLHKKKESLTLNKEAKETFNVLKRAIMTAPVLT